LKLTKTSVSTLHNGVEIPRIGLGTWQITGKYAYKAVKWALEAGYRHIDTALFYKNEAEVGRAIRESEIDREDIFVTSKLWNADQGYESALQAIDKTLDNLGFDYVDLYLIHWPVPDKRVESWKALEHIYEEQEKVRAIGVSNFMILHLEELLPEAAIVPMVNQVEFTPFLYLEELKQLCEDYDIQVEAYSPLTHGKKLDNPTLVELGKKYDKQPAQILIRWGLQQDVVEIPKSSTKAHIQANIDVFDFELSSDDMKQLNSLHANYRAGGWDPTSSRRWH